MHQPHPHFQPPEVQVMHQKPPFFSPCSVIGQSQPMTSSHVQSEETTFHRKEDEDSIPCEPTNGKAGGLGEVSENGVVIVGADGESGGLKEISEKVVVISDIDGESKSLVEISEKEMVSMDIDGESRSLEEISEKSVVVTNAGGEPEGLEEINEKVLVVREDIKQNVSVDVIPMNEGMVYATGEEGFEHYKKHAASLGFYAIKRSSKKDVNGKYYEHLFCCRKHGKPREKETKVYTRRRRPQVHTGCKARVVLKLFDEDGIFHVTKMVSEHNHELLDKSESQFLQNDSMLGESVKMQSKLNNKPGMAPSKSFHSFVTQAEGYDNLNFRKKDCSNHIKKTRRLNLGVGDAEALHLYFLQQSQLNSQFFYMIDLDDEGRLRNVFWADARSREACQYFGDVVTFDSTYLINKYNIPFLPFIGVDNHRHSILLGAGLISEEVTETYIWLCRAWLLCMSNCPPKVILSDQCKAMANAIAEVFPTAQHRLCIWHILKKVPEKLGAYEAYHAIRQRLSGILYESMTKTEFDEEWTRMIEDFQLHDNKWLKSLYDERGSWAPVYVNDTFCAGMSDTQGSEEMNSFFDGYLTPKSSVKEFVQQFESAIKFKYEKEAKEDCRSKDNAPQVISSFEFEEQLAEVYTINMFSLFQKEIIKLLGCNATLVKTEGVMSSYQVGECIDGKAREYCVLYNGEEVEVKCGCWSFEFKGIVCCHALRVLLVKGVRKLPERYVLDRWRKDYKWRHSILSSSSAIVPESQVERRDKLYKECIPFVMEAINIGQKSEFNYKFVLKAMAEMIKTVRSMDAAVQNMTQTNPSAFSSHQVPLEGDDGASPSMTIRSQAELKRKGCPLGYRKIGDAEKTIQTAKIL